MQNRTWALPGSAHMVQILEIWKFLLGLSYKNKNGWIPLISEDAFADLGLEEGNNGSQAKHALVTV